MATTLYSGHYGLWETSIMMTYKFKSSEVKSNVVCNKFFYVKIYNQHIRSNIDKMGYSIWFLIKKRVFLPFDSLSFCDAKLYFWQN